MKRDAFFDNAKLFLIVLVVFGHAMQPMTEDSAFMYSLYTFIYTFHMPAFILLAGFFAKGSKDKNYIMQMVKKLLLPYLLFQAVYSGYYYALGDSGWFNGFFHPHWSLWFLVSLFCWHILLIGFKRIPPVLGILISLELGLIIGYFSEIGHTYSLSRTFVFFPFFLAGYWLTKEQVKKWQKPSVRLASLGIMGIVATCIALFPEFSSGWLLGSKSYATLGIPEAGGWLRLGVYILAAVMTVAVLSWVPSRHFSFTKLGQRTLYVYLLHGFFIQFFRKIDLFTYTHWLDIVGVFAIAVGIVYILSSKFIMTIAGPLIETKLPRKRKTEPSA
ncbi:acyltransferase family protein [Salimicrobium flavidum]|uniref:Fucose 4-O-acetylase n=1 Tax=Salimicrobium flavidum TaxID=570947 RepID=A0A1N7IV29_9BACI|nr:acyltransferase family protein [Salimicrobium flavidum]SIS40914.1 Fucose 4-O-acetylase [Salimicrobium flavidum]